MSAKIPLVAVMGPTAVGKTAVAERLAGAIGARLINADAFQMYRGLDIGTAKPADRAAYRLIDILEPAQSFGVGEFVSLAAEELRSCHREGVPAVVVGGTGLYVRALFEGYSHMRPPPDPELRAEIEARRNEFGPEWVLERLRSRDPEAYDRVDRANPRRVQRALERTYSDTQVIHEPLPPFVRLKIGLDANVEALNSRIVDRTREMVQNGWVCEVRSLAKNGVLLEDPGMKAIGYREMWLAAKGRLELEVAIGSTIVRTRQYAKRQRTWLKKEPNLLRIDAFDVAAIDNVVDKVVKMH